MESNLCPHSLSASLSVLAVIVLSSQNDAGGILMASPQAEEGLFLFRSDFSFYEHGEIPSKRIGASDPSAYPARTSSNGGKACRAAIQCPSSPFCPSCFGASLTKPLRFHSMESLTTTLEKRTIHLNITLIVSVVVRGGIHKGGKVLGQECEKRT